MSGKLRNLASRGVAPLNPGNLAADDVSWPSTAMLRGYDDRRFGDCLAGRLTRVLVAPAPWDAESNGRVPFKADNSLLEEVSR